MTTVSLLKERGEENEKEREVRGEKRKRRGEDRRSLKGESAPPLYILNPKKF
jgi:hypothetical protein